MNEAMSIQSFNFMLKKIALQSGLPTVEAVFDGFDKVKIVLSTDGNYEGITRNYYVSVEKLTGDYDFEWLFEAADALRRGEK
jgi:hypothetical protein